MKKLEYEDRLKYNNLIIEQLKHLINKHPDLRFGQILINSGVINCTVNTQGIPVVDDPFYEESKNTWQRMLLNKFAFYEQYN